jgi:hypothetical protein
MRVARRFPENDDLERSFAEQAAIDTAWRWFRRSKAPRRRDAYFVTPAAALALSD